MKKSIAMFLLGATIAFGIAYSASVIANAYVKVQKRESIRVKGSASRLIKSDKGSWTGSIQTKAQTIEEGYNKIEKDMNMAKQKVMFLGFGDAEMSLSDVSISQIYKVNEKGNSTNELDYYRLSQTISVESDNVEGVEAVSRKFTELLKLGVYATSGYPCFTVSTLNDYRLSLLAEATENAKDRADILVSKSGGKVGTLIDGSQGIFQILAPGGSDISDYGTYDKSTIMKEMRAIVTLEFELK